MYVVCLDHHLHCCLSKSTRPPPPQPTNTFPELLNNNVTNSDSLRNLFEYLSVCPSPEKALVYQLGIDCLHHMHGKFHQEKIFANFTTHSHWWNFYHTNSSCINDCIEDMVTFTALVKIYSTKLKYFCEVAGLGKIFVRKSFHVYSSSD